MRDPESVDRFVRRLEMALADGHYARAHSIVDECERESSSSPDEITLGTSLAATSLPMRVIGLLERAGIVTIGDCLQRTPDELANIPSLGDLSVRTIIKTLRALPITVPDDA